MASGSPDVCVVSIGGGASKKEWNPFQVFRRDSSSWEGHLPELRFCYVQNLTSGETPPFAEGAERSDILLGLRLETRRTNIYEEMPLSTANSPLKAISRNRVRASKKRMALNARERMARKKTNALHASGEFNVVNMSLHNAAMLNVLLYFKNGKGGGILAERGIRSFSGM